MLRTADQVLLPWLAELVHGCCTHTVVGSVVLTESSPSEYLKTLHADAMTLSHGRHLIMKHGSLVTSLQKVVAI